MGLIEQTSFPIGRIGSTESIQLDNVIRDVDSLNQATEQIQTTVNNMSWNLVEFTLSAEDIKNEMHNSIELLPTPESEELYYEFRVFKYNKIDAIGSVTWVEDSPVTYKNDFIIIGDYINSTGVRMSWDDLFNNRNVLLESSNSKYNGGQIPEEETYFKQLPTAPTVPLGQPIKIWSAGEVPVFSSYSGEISLNLKVYYRLVTI